MTQPPRLTLPGGKRLPAGWRALHALALRGKDPDGWLQKQLWFHLPDRLPAVVAEYPDGRRFLAPRGDQMYAQVFMHGAYEPETSAVIAQLVREGDFAVDVGANHGWYSLLIAAGAGPAGLVWAIEPVPPMVDALRRNLELNPGLPIGVFPIALGSSDGELELHLFSGLPHGHASASTLGRDDYDSFRVDKRTLDGLLADGPGREPALVKIDVEGAELDVLRGATGLASSDSAPIWLLEVNYDTSDAFGYKPPDLLTELESAGAYSIFRITDDGLIPETAPAEAPHGAIWVCSPPARMDRVEPAVVRV